jgi:hypothetical protein
MAGEGTRHPVKDVELANLAGDALDDVEAAERGLQRIRVRSVHGEPGAWDPRLARDVIALPRNIPTSTILVEVAASPSPGHSTNCELAQGRALHPEDNLASGVTCFQVSHRLGGVTQRVGPVDDGRDLAGLDQVFHHQQVLPAPSGQERAQPLAQQR